MYAMVDGTDGTGLYSWGLYTTTGAAICTVTATHLASGGATSAAQSACTQTTPITIAAGQYVLAFTGNATVATSYTAGQSFNGFSGTTSSTTSSGGQVPGTISIPTAGNQVTPYGTMSIAFD